MWAARTKETIAMLMIGDGLLAVVEPRRHCELWKAGPPFWRALVDPLVENPALARIVGAAEMAAGFWLASCQTSPGRPGCEVQRLPGSVE